MGLREKVIKGLRCCRNIHLGATLDDSCNICPFQTNKGQTCNANELFFNTINLLKTQEPVEPVFTAMIETDMSYWSCGACGAFIFGNAYPHMLPENKSKYCGYCGRKVKWE